MVNEIMNVKHLTVLAIKNPSITAEQWYYLSCELGVVIFALPASQSCYKSRLMEKLHMESL